MSAIWVNQEQFNTPFKFLYRHEHNALNLRSCVYFFRSLSSDNNQYVMSLGDNDLVWFGLVEGIFLKSF